MSEAHTTGGTTPILLHACCGPCSLEPVRLLREEGFEPTICWTNPNIQPVAEYERRLSTLRAWTAEEGIPLIEAGCDREAWERACAPFGFDRERRCRACYALRLAEACRVARERGFAIVSTTLAVSPYQLFDVCSEELVAIARAFGLEPLVRDWRPNYPQATRRSRELGMYRQNYCGCRFSALEAQLDRQRMRDERRARKAAVAAGGDGHAD
jgi:predicted adenine nucleotide alpha hydrolase (AANH) superfamily ATPase